MVCGIVNGYQICHRPSELTAHSLAMFHGVCDLPRYIEESDRHTREASIHITRNVRQMPDVFEASILLVVSRRVRDALKGTVRGAFIPVVFDGLFDIDWQEGERLMDDGATLTDFVSPELLEASPEYFTFMAAYYSDIIAGFPMARPVNVLAQAAVLAFGKMVKVALASQMFQAYGAIKTEYGYIFGDTALRVVEPYLDRQFFEIAPVRVP